MKNDSGKVASAAFAPNGHSLASGGEDGTVRIWNLSHLGKYLPMLHRYLLMHINILERNSGLFCRSSLPIFGMPN
ncbi:hypothetical protein [Bradyrhizobium sp. SZCCHNR2017]|uniref:hypothetical protein n=1 Tax=unclassified Bradyrhizobium TaxID=2631580 RepID=UPI003966A54B